MFCSLAKTSDGLCLNTKTYGFKVYGQSLWCFPLTLTVKGTEQKNRDRAAIGRRALSSQYNAALTPAQLFESGKWHMLGR
jgi:hypothetical protein